MTAAEVRVPRVRLIVATGALVACAAILWLSRTYTFYFDEWTFITTAPDWTFWSYFEPHNEHPSILFRAVYAALLNTVGLRTYLPYMALLLVAHFANVVLLFELVRRRAGDLVGMAAAALLLVLGAGWEDVLWAFQMAWLASVAFGLGALLLLQSQRRIGFATACVTASLAFSGIGAVFATAAAVQLALTPARRRDLLWFVPVGVAVAVWYVAFGRFGEHPNPQPTAANLLLDPLYALWGLSQSAAGLIGLGGWVGVPVLAVVAAVIAWRWMRRRPDAFGVSAVVALVTFYLLTGLTRAQLGYEQSGSSRYIYVAAVLWLIVLGDLARDLPWRGTWRPALVACVFLAFFNSGVLLFSYAAARSVLMERQVADFYALSAMRSDPCLAHAGAVDLLVMPVETDPAAYYRALDRYGDPRAGMPLLDRASYEKGVRNLRKANC
jgi:hypothetical protein